MHIRQKLIRITATIIYVLKYRAIHRANVKFLVFTGTVGKTTLRNTIASALEFLELPVQSNSLGYSNELGVVLQAIGIQRFSPKNPSDWIRVIRADIPKEQYVCIELGADFYSDIPWFLKKFTPYAIFISGIAEYAWSRNITEITDERTQLLKAVPQQGQVFYNHDDPAIRALITSAPIQGTVQTFSLESDNDTADISLQYWSKNIYTMNVSNAENAAEKITVKTKNHSTNLSFYRPIFEPQIYAILATMGFIESNFTELLNEDILQRFFSNYHFSDERLQFHTMKSGGIILEDSYKATPMCTFWFLEMAQRMQAAKKVVVLTEMRPLTHAVEKFYVGLGEKTKFADQSYFIGPKEYYACIKKSNPHVQHISEFNYTTLWEELIKNTKQGDCIFLKGSHLYNLGNFRRQLL